jgi:hypothetical protein
LHATRRSDTDRIRISTRTKFKEEPEPKVSGNDVARFFDVDNATVRRWKREGCPVLYYSSKLVRYELSKVEAWLKERGSKRIEVIPPHVRKEEQEKAKAALAASETNGSIQTPHNSTEPVTTEAAK